MRLGDREPLRSFRANPSAETFLPFLERYLPLVYGSAHRQLGTGADAAEVTRAVFLAFARRGRSLSRRTILAGWFFRATRLTCGKVARARRRVGGAPPRAASPGAGVARDDDTWARLAPLLDPALDRMRAKYRDGVLLRFVLGWDLEDSARTLRLRPKRAAKRTARGFDKLLQRLRKRQLWIDAHTLGAVLAANASGPAAPPELQEEIVAAAQSCFRRRPTLALARSTLGALTWWKWKRRLKIAAGMAGALALLVGAVAGSVAVLWKSGKLLPMLIEFGARQQLKELPELAEPVRHWPDDPSGLPAASTLRSAGELYQTTNIWLAHLKFTPEHWSELTPKRIPAVPKIILPDGTIVLRNPQAQRSGIAGALGFDFNWTRADFEFSGVHFTNVAARLRGNGTYLGSLYGSKHPHKVDLDKFEKRQQLAGIHTLNFNNLIEDRSHLSDALGYEVFRNAGVPSPRTAYAWLTVSVEGQFEQKPLGLYALVENVDADFAEDRFGSRRTPIFKPVTPDLFMDLGEDWAVYAPIYDLKTKATPEQQRRVIDFARLLTHANDQEFAQRLGEFLDLDPFARFLAALVFVANYDSLLTYGQNYYLYLDPRTDKFGFIPWDLDQAWGSFSQFGTALARERASIWRPWVGRNRFLERVLNVDEFRQIYQDRMRELLATAFVPERLCRRIDEIAPVIREPIAAESAFRLRLFDQAISTNWLSGPRNGGDGPKRPVHQIKRFIANRAKSVGDQLEGKSRGLILWQSAQW